MKTSIGSSEDIYELMDSRRRKLHKYLSEEEAIHAHSLICDTALFLDGVRNGLSALLENYSIALSFDLLPQDQDQILIYKRLDEEHHFLIKPDELRRVYGKVKREIRFVKTLEREINLACHVIAENN